MAKTKKELFSFARQCEGFNLRLESGLKKKGSDVVFVLARYHGGRNGNMFPAKVVRKAFEHAQMRADELGQEVRIVMEASLKEEFGGGDDLFAIATIKPREVFDPINIRAPFCSMCLQLATQKCLTGFAANKWGGPSVVIEHGCDEHISGIMDHWR